MTNSVKLADLCGVRVLDGRGEFVRKSEYASDNARVVVLRLDGDLYWF